MKKIMIYHQHNGTITILLPKGMIPDRQTLEAVAQAVAGHKKSPAQSGNSERDKAHALADQEDCTTEE